MAERAGADGSALTAALLSVASGSTNMLRRSVKSAYAGWPGSLCLHNEADARLGAQLAHAP